MVPRHTADTLTPVRPSSRSCMQRPSLPAGIEGARAFAPVQKRRTWPALERAANFVAVLFANTSPFAETSPDAGPRMNGPHSCSTIAAAVFFIGREDFRARAVALVLCAAQLCKREPADGA